MKCHVCGEDLRPILTDLPLKKNDRCIVIFKSLPVLQCDNCGEYLLDDQIMIWVETTLEGINPSAELEIVRYAA